MASAAPVGQGRASSPECTRALPRQTISPYAHEPGVDRHADLSTSGPAAGSGEKGVRAGVVRRPRPRGGGIRRRCRVGRGKPCRPASSRCRCTASRRGGGRDDFDDWTDEEEEGEGRGGPDIQAAMHASFESLRDDRAKRAQLKEDEAVQMAQAARASLSEGSYGAVYRAHRRKQHHDTTGASCSRRSP